MENKEAVVRLVGEELQRKLNQKDVDEGLAMRLRSGDIVYMEKVGELVRKVIAETQPDADESSDKLVARIAAKVKAICPVAEDEPLRVLICRLLDENKLS
jgi:hypothetical protein